MTLHASPHPTRRSPPPPTPLELPSPFSPSRPKNMSNRAHLSPQQTTPHRKTPPLTYDASASAFAETSTTTRSPNIRSLTHHTTPLLSLLTHHIPHTPDGTLSPRSNSVPNNPETHTSKSPPSSTSSFTHFTSLDSASLSRLLVHVIPLPHGARAIVSLFPPEGVCRHGWRNLGYNPTIALADPISRLLH
jgi:hypothetical protein